MISVSNQEVFRLGRGAALALAAVVLAGCASGPGGVQLSDLRTSTHFRDERVVPGSFPSIQQALFKHEAACGHAAKLVMDPRETNYATLIEMPEPASSYERAVVVDVVQYKPSYFAGPRMRAKTYTYYSDAATLKRIDLLFASLNHPGICDGKVPANRKSDETQQPPPGGWLR